MFYYSKTHVFTNPIVWLWDHIWESFGSLLGAFGFTLGTFLCFRRDLEFSQIFTNFQGQSLGGQDGISPKIWTHFVKVGARGAHIL